MDIESVQRFPLDQLGSYQIESVLMEYDILCRNSQDENEQEFYTFDQVSYEVRKWKVFNYSEVLPRRGRVLNHLHCIFGFFTMEKSSKTLNNI